MQTDNIRVILTAAGTDRAPDAQTVAAALDEALALVVGALSNLDRIAAALEVISLNTHPRTLAGGPDYAARTQG